MRPGVQCTANSPVTQDALPNSKCTRSDGPRNTLKPHSRCFAGRRGAPPWGQWPPCQFWLSHNPPSHRPHDPPNRFPNRHQPLLQLLLKPTFASLPPEAKDHFRPCAKRRTTAAMAIAAPPAAAASRAAVGAQPTAGASPHAAHTPTAVHKGGGGEGFATPTDRNLHGDALCFMVKTWARHKATETGLNNGWRLTAVGGWRLVAVN